MKIKESEKRNKSLDLARKPRKLCNIKVTVIPLVIGALGTVPKDLERGMEELEIRRRIKTMQTVEIGLNTEKSPGDLRRLAVSQTLTKDHQLILK